MRSMNWNDLRYILAVSRGGTLAAAARLMEVDDTTVARRLRAMQEMVGARLYRRLANGTLRLTTSGERAARHAERIEREVGAFGRVVPAADDASGTVRVTSVPIVVNHLLVPSTQDLLKRHRQLRLELIADGRDLSLTRREADIALRLARPKTGGAKVSARRIGTMRYGAYAAASLSAHEAKKLPWITYDETMAHLPQARWIAATVSANDERIAAVHVNDAEALREAVIAGLGRSLLPCVVANGDPRLRRLDLQSGPPAPARELWLLTHSEAKTVRRIAAVAEWIEQVVPRQVA